MKEIHYHWYTMTRYIFSHPNFFFSLPHRGADIVLERDLLKNALNEVMPVGGETKGGGDTLGTERRPHARMTGVLAGPVMGNGPGAMTSRGGLRYPSAGYAISEVELPTRNDGVPFIGCQPRVHDLKEKYVPEAGIYIGQIASV